MTLYFERELSTQQSSFNCCIISCQIKAGKAVGTWIKRFGTLCFALHLRLNTVTRVIIVTMKQQNLFIDHLEQRNSALLAHADNKVQVIPVIRL